MNCCHFVHTQPVKLSVMISVEIHVKLNMHVNICNIMMMKLCYGHRARVNNLCRQAL